MRFSTLPFLLFSSSLCSLLTSCGDKAEIPALPAPPEEAQLKKVYKKKKTYHRPSSYLPNFNENARRNDNPYGSEPPNAYDAANARELSNNKAPANQTPSNIIKPPTN